jgi:tetratricopeptide (TPR) repeat protein
MNGALKMTRAIFFPALCAWLWLACASVRFLEDLAAYENKIKGLEAKIQANSNNAQALRDLGVIYFQTRNNAQAEAYLRKAFVQNAQDPKTIFYLGMALEFQNKIDEALSYHQRYREVSRLSPYRRLMEGRYRRLGRDIARRELRALLQQERQLPESRMSARAIAVFPLRYLGKDKKFAPLGKGLSEMIIGDLGQVRQLKLLERIRLQILLEEMALAESEYFDQSTAPRFGKLLGAGRLVAGTFNVSDKEQLQVEVLSWDVITGFFPAAATASDLLQNLFRLEKDLVFKVVAEMGIELTPQEEEKIRFIPTQSLQAFLTYCRGLEAEDAGRFEAAAGFYQQAKQLDPNFELAGTKAEEAESLSKGGGSKEQAVTVAQTADPPIAPDTPAGRIDLVADRLENLSGNVGSNFFPGQDNRKAAEEAGRAFGDLGKPPAPPPPRP